MKATYTEKRPCIGGSFSTYHITETDQWKGQSLGAELTSAHKLQVAQCDHYTNEDSEGIELERGHWVKKSLVNRVFWQTDRFGTTTLCRVEYARPETQ